MSAPGDISTASRLAVAALSGYRVLDLLRSTAIRDPIPSEDFEEAIYLTQQPWAARHPDHVFRMASKKLQSNLKTSGSPLFLQCLADEFLVVRHGKIHVKLEKFGLWQQRVVSRISGQPIEAYRLHHALRQGENVPMPGGRISPLLRPWDSAVEDYVRREGVHETHLHLNGSTHAENCWLLALKNIRYEVDAVSKKFEGAKNKKDREGLRFRELILQIDPAMSPKKLYIQLELAKSLRDWLKGAFTDRFNFAVLSLDDIGPLRYVDDWRHCPSGWGRPLVDDKVGDEVRWMSGVLSFIEDNPGHWIDRLFMIYLLLQNQYYQMLVQGEAQYGFDQFQRFTYAPFRWTSEEVYDHRMNLMHGECQDWSRTAKLEGRFSPKDEVDKNEALFVSILGSYCRYLTGKSGFMSSGLVTKEGVGESLSVILKKLNDLGIPLIKQGRRVHHLGLVAHFIKARWDGEGPYRHHALRKRLSLQAEVLGETLKRWPGLRHWVRGIDAASNELDASAEVFAVCYRACQRAGLTRRTYHAGEDFIHLISGIRAMLDAIELLDLRDGDRIGHGTAMGIHPELWLARSPSTMLVSQGDWLLDLLAAWRLLRDFPEHFVCAQYIQRELAAGASRVFSREISAQTFEATMGCRHLDPELVRKVLQHRGQLPPDALLEWHSTSGVPPYSVSSLERFEIQLVEDMRVKNPHALLLYWTWHNDRDLRKHTEAIIEVQSDILGVSALIALQQALMQRMFDRRVIVETLPSSNVRISLYENFSEHHALRWIKAPAHAVKGDPEVLVSLGSDDPGIFASDLSGELYHLYAVLRQEGDSDQQALARLAQVNERGRQYAFHPH